jgi:hypothetical protein
MNAINVHCLANKPDVARWITAVDYLLFYWGLQFEGGSAPSPPFAAQYCVDLRLDAAPPPVVTVGQAVQFPIDVRLRFTDGVDVPGPVAALVTVTASNGTVEPAGGGVQLPVSTNLTLTPTALSGTLTLTAVVTDFYYETLPSRSKTFQIGEPPPLVFGDEPDLFGLLRAQQVPNPASQRTQHSRTLPGAALDLAWPTPNELLAARLTATRNIVGASAGFTAALSGTVELSLTPPPSSQPVVADDEPYQTYVVEAIVSDSWSVTLPTAFTVVVGLSPGAELWIGNQLVRAGDQLTLSAGEQAVSFKRLVRLTNTKGVPEGEASATPSYTLTFTPVP